MVAVWGLRVYEFLHHWFYKTIYFGLHYRNHVLMFVWTLKDSWDCLKRFQMTSVSGQRCLKKILMIAWICFDDFLKIAWWCLKKVLDEDYSMKIFDDAWRRFSMKITQWRFLTVFGCVVIWTCLEFWWWFHKYLGLTDRHTNIQWSTELLPEPKRNRCQIWDANNSRFLWLGDRRCWGLSSLLKVIRGWFY